MIKEKFIQCLLYIEHRIFQSACVHRYKLEKSFAMKVNGTDIHIAVPVCQICGKMRDIHRSGKGYA